MKKPSSAKRIRIALVGGGAAATRLAQALRRSDAVIVEKARRASGDPDRVDLVLDLRRKAGKKGFRRGNDVPALMGILAAEIEGAIRREIEERQSDFVSITSHELRTPLASSREAVSIVADGLAGGITEEQRRYLEIATRNLRRLTGVINQLLDLSDFEGRRLALSKDPTDLNDVAAAAAARIEPCLRERRIRFVFRRARGPLVAAIDAERIGHALDALLDNASKFTPPGGAVWLRLRGNSTGVEIEVEDTGIGIPDEARPLIFQKFRQVDRALTRSRGGLGLGLTLVREIVRSHGGRLRLRTEAGRGSRFVIWLPRGGKKP